MPTKTRLRLLVLALIILAVSWFNSPRPPAEAAGPELKLPFPAGVSYVVTTIPGEGSHKSGRGSKAYDFGMPLASEIVASVSGKVLLAYDKSEEGACDISYWTKANYVVLDNGNGYSTLYLHLLPHSLQVKVGDQVSQGQTLALSGQTGYTCNVAGGPGPHLHFQLQTMGSCDPTVPWWCTSTDASFNDSPGRLQHGQRVTSANTRPLPFDRNDRGSLCTYRYSVCTVPINAVVCPPNTLKCEVGSRYFFNIFDLRVYVFVTLMIFAEVPEGSPMMSSSCLIDNQSGKTFRARPFLNEVRSSGSFFGELQFESGTLVPGTTYTFRYGCVRTQFPDIPLPAFPIECTVRPPGGPVWC